MALSPKRIRCECGIGSDGRGIEKKHVLADPFDFFGFLDFIAIIRVKSEPGYCTSFSEKSAIISPKKTYARDIKKNLFLFF